MSAERDDPRSVNDFLLDPRMRSRLARALRRAFHTGIALYLLSTLLLVTMAWCLREAVTQVWRNRSDIGREIDKHLRSHPDVGSHQPDEPAILAMTFDAAQAPGEDEDILEARRQAQRIERSFLAIATDMLASDEPGCERGAEAPPSSLTRFDKELPDTTSPERRKAWKEQLKQHLCGYREKPCLQLVTPCGEGTYTRPRDEFTFGAPGCDPGERLARLFVPSAFNECRSQPACSPQSQCLVAPQPSCGGTSCFPRRIHEAAALSRPLDVLLEAFAQERCQADPWKSSLVSIYFITPENIVREWTCALASGRPEARPYRHPVSTTYIHRLLRRTTPAEYETDTYLDTNGFGPIRTRCVRIEQPHTHEPRLMGVLCFDFTVPVQHLLEPLARSTVVTVELAEVRMPDAGGDLGVSEYWKVDVPRRRETLARVRDRLSAAGEGDRNGLAQELALAIHQFKAQGRDDREIRVALGTTVVELSDVESGGAPGNGRFLVPGGWTDEGRSRMMLILRPAVATLRGAKVLLGLSWLLFLLWVLLLWRGNVLARRMSENELVVQLLRKLGIGVVLLDEDGLIMAANDEAENILGMYLPQLNVWRLRIDEGFRQARYSSDPVVRVLELIHPTVVMAADKVEDLKAIEYRNIWQARLRGRPAMFYAKLKKGPEDKLWVKVTAAPVVIKRRGKKQLTTSLSAMDPVHSTDLRNALDRLVVAPGAKSWI